MFAQWFAKTRHDLLNDLCECSLKLLFLSLAFLWDPYVTDLIIVLHMRLIFIDFHYCRYYLSL